MKQILIALLATTATLGTAMASNPKNILTDKLPKEARQLIRSNYPHQTLTRLTTHWENDIPLYQAKLDNGTRLYFDSFGDWNVIDNPDESLPKGIVPRKITRYVKKNFPNQYIVTAAHNPLTGSYGIILDNDWELTFDEKENYTGW